ncbi:oocyte zinc finger protein XlCOF29-like [Xenopus laevis]|uniref:Oocyte zinc finger protein XlCOF29-like n=1 Tax=Xenopus laevis TaxID=8355 RepID=A0A8J1KQL9_XENLA|nr:oocyte zinc finger protein XlCOF29-like [Xenopus laevis]
MGPHFPFNLMGISQEPTEPVMGNQDPDQLHETILTLTLEIIYLLTGEGYSVTKKSGADMPLPQSCTDCMLGGACRHHVTSPTVAPPPGSVIQKENAKKILELMSNIIQLLTGEVAIRCEDVSLYFSLEEWQYLKGNKTRYREVIKENWEQLRPLGCGHEDVNDIKPDPEARWDPSDPPNASPTDLQTLTNCISHGIKEELTSWADWTINPTTEQIPGADPAVGSVASNQSNSLAPDHISHGIKGEANSWGEGNPPNPEISPTDPQTPTNCISHGIKGEADSWEEGNPPNPEISPTDPQTLTICISHGIKGEADSWGEGNPPNPEISPTDPQTPTTVSLVGLTGTWFHGQKESCRVRTVIEKRLGGQW